MNQARKIFVALLVLISFLLTGCSGTDTQGNETPSEIMPHYVNLPDGRVVLCVFEYLSSGGGLSCDWANAKRDPFHLKAAA